MSKNLYNNIKKLKKIEIRNNEEIEIYNEEGQKLTEDETTKEIKRYWQTIYQKHENKIDEIWNEATKREYIVIFNGPGNEENNEE